MDFVLSFDEMITSAESGAVVHMLNVYMSMHFCVFGLFHSRLLDSGACWKKNNTTSIINVATHCYMWVLRCQLS